VAQQDLAGSDRNRGELEVVGCILVEDNAGQGAGVDRRPKPQEIGRTDLDIEERERVAVACGRRPRVAAVRDNPDPGLWAGEAVGDAVTEGLRLLQRQLRRQDLNGEVVDRGRRVFRPESDRV